MEINLGLTQLSLLCTIVRHQGVITAARLSWKAAAKIAAFLKKKIYFSPPRLSLIFTVHCEQNMELGDKF